LDICYAAIGVVVNDAAGRGASKDGIRVEDIQRGLEDLMGRVRVVLEELVVLAHPESCPV
jgi:5'-methylthioadenosine phosphorylase